MKKFKILCLSLISIPTIVTPILSLSSCGKNQTNDEIIVDKKTVELDPVNSPDGYYGEFNFILPEQPFDDLVDIVLSNYNTNTAKVNFLNKTTRYLKVEDKKINIKFCLDEIKNKGENKFDLTFTYKDANYNVLYKKITGLSLNLISVPTIEKTGYTCFYAYKKSIFKLIKSDDRVVLPDCYYSSDKITWNKYNEGQTVIIQPGQKLYLKGNNPDGWSKQYLYTTISISGEVAIGGNVMSLISNNEAGTNTIPNEYCFGRLFDDQPCIIHVNKNFFPAMNLKNNCYYQAFRHCTNLKNAVDLPATILADNCYESLFEYCSSLIEVPTTLPAKELKPNCYYYMFANCDSLISAPKLLCTKAAPYACSEMFARCKKLELPPEDLTVDELAECCYDHMFYSCDMLSTMPKLNNMVLAKGCYTSMFGGCKALTNLSKLPATNLAEECYKDMFRDSGITKTPELGMINLAPYCCSGMFSGCDVTETIDFSKEYVLAESCFYEMYSSCNRLQSTYKTTIGTQSVLPKGCFDYLFFGCNNLKMIKVGFTKWTNADNESFTNNWVDAMGTKPLGIFFCPTGLKKIFDKSHIPVNDKYQWTVLHE